MEAFSLIAKLLLNTDEYKKALSDAENEGSHISDPNEPSLGLDISPFESEVDEAENTDVADPDSPELDLDTSKYKGSLDQAQEDTETWSDTVGGIFNKLKGVIVAAGITAVVTKIVTGLSEAVNLASSLGDDIDKGSRRLNISAKAYQEWNHALSQSGATINDFSRGILSMNKYMSGADVTEDVSNAFDKLGVSAKVANGEITNTEGLLTETVKALADFSGTKEERGALATAIFGRGGNTLNALFDSGSEGIQQLIDEAHELGLVMTDEEVANSVAYGDAVANMQASIDAFKTSIVTSLLPALTDVANTISSIVAFFNPRTKQKSLSDIYADSDKKFAEQLVDIEATGEAAETLVDKLLAMGDTSKMTADQYKIWQGTAQALIDLVPTLGEVIDTESGKINGNSESIKENIKQWENLARQKALQTLKEEKYQAIVEKEKDLIDATIEANKEASKAEAEKTKAYHAFSDEMEKRGLGTLDFEAGDLDAQIKAVMDSLAEMGDSGESDALALGVAMKNLGDATTEAGKAQAKVDKLTAEIAKGRAEYEEWVATAESLYGIASKEATTATSDVNTLNASLDKLPKSKQIQIDLLVSGTDGLSFARHWKGSAYIPYDNYPALLDRGEKILTATEARQETNQSSYGISVEEFGYQMKQILGKINVLMDGEKVGDLTTKRVKDNINASSYSRLRSMGG